MERGGDPPVLGQGERAAGARAVAREAAEGGAAWRKL